MVTKVLHRKVKNIILSTLMRGTQRRFSVKYLFGQKQILPRIFYSLRTTKKFLIIAPFMYNFLRLPNKFPTILWSLIFHISLPRLGYFSYEKET